MKNFKHEVLIVGGFGHIGLPLGILFAEKGLSTCLYDIDKKAFNIIKKGQMPFTEYGAQKLLKKNLISKKLKLSLNINSIKDAKNVIITIGTPVDEYLNPKTKQFVELFKTIIPYLNKSQNVIIRSSVFPDTCKRIFSLLKNKKFNVSYCPERIVQGYGIEELQKLPQIVSGFSKNAINNSSILFKNISPRIIKTSVKEAELIKLFTNSLRYIQFATANQFYMICENFNVNYKSLRNSLIDGYERAKWLPSAGFASGPCLMKDTMQLAAFNKNNFPLGHSAMLLNEGLPNFIVDGLLKKYDLTKKKVGVLGMTFKANVDDTRDSLSFKLAKILEFKGAKVLCSDEFAKNKDFVSKEKVLKEADIIIIGTPHKIYKELKIPKRIKVINIW
tara:strand:- start:1111 stop:2277 length:1167 start_codon:yes stop_codon:yes gene_type:complete